MAALTVLALRGNQLSGPVPGALGRLTNLVDLSLPDNALSGSIPTELGNLTNLWSLELGNNRLTGPIPSELGGMTGLGYLYLNGNRLSGSIPSGLGRLTGLVGMSLWNNELEGEIPSDFADLTALQFLWLAGTLVNCDPLTYDPPNQRLRDFLDQLGADFICRQHPPKAPSGRLVLTEYNTALGVSWETPDSGDLAITGFEVQWVRKGDPWEEALQAKETYLGGSRQVGGSARSYIIRGLGGDDPPVNIEYAVRVRAINALGNGYWSAAAHGTARLDAPPPPGSGGGG